MYSWIIQKIYSFDEAIAEKVYRIDFLEDKNDYEDMIWFDMLLHSGINAFMLEWIYKYEEHLEKDLTELFAPTPPWLEALMFFSMSVKEWKLCISFNVENINFMEENIQERFKQYIKYELK